MSKKVQTPKQIRLTLEQKVETLEQIAKLIDMRILLNGMISLHIINLGCDIRKFIASCYLHVHLTEFF